MKREEIEKMFDGITGGITPNRLENLEATIKSLTEEQLSRLRIVECTDEYTGQRYGMAKCRIGQCAKLGGGGRNRGSRYAYQVWAVWN